MEGLTHVSLDVAGERFELRGDGSLYWPAKRVLVVSDVHLGKTESYRGQGVALPDGVMYDDLVRLAAAVEDTGARSVVVTGDLIHDAAGLTSSVRQALRQWQQTIECELHLVRGNHDRKVRSLPEEWGIEVHDPCLVIEGFAFSHEGAVPGFYSWVGHLHPVVRFSSGVDAVRVPCFHVGESVGVLPAFTTFSHGLPIDPRRGDRVVAATGGRAFDLTKMVAP